ncbi:hypothetical protein [Aquifex sp.]
MNDINFSGKISEVEIPSFSNAHTIPPDIPVGGIFFAWDDNEHTQTLVKIFDSWVNHYVSVLEALISNKKIRRDTNWRKKVLNEANKLRKISLSFFNDRKSTGIKETKVKLLSSVEPAKNQLIGRDKTNFIAYFGKPSAEGELSFYYIDVNFAKEIRELNEALINNKIDETEYREKLGELKLKAIEEVLKEAVKVAEEEVANFFELLLKLIEESKEDVIAKKILERMLKIEVEFGIGTSQEEEDVGDIEVFKPVLTKLGYFPSPLTFKEALIRLGKSLREEIGEIRDEEELVEEIKELLKELNALEFFQKLYSDEEFLKRVRKALSEVLKGKSEKIKGIHFSRGGELLFKGSKNIYSQGKYIPLILYENKELRKDIAEHGKDKFITPKSNEYLFLEELIDGKGTFGDEISFFFPSWNHLVKYERERRLKGKNPGLYEGNAEILAFLLSFSAFFTALRIIRKNRGIKVIPFFFLDIENRSFEDENGYYYFWQLARAYLDYIYPHPSQTITKETLDSLKKVSVFKNAFISALKGDRKVVLKADEGIKIKGNTLLYLLVENKSVKLYDKAPHYLYSLFKVVITDKEISIEKEEKNFFIFVGGRSGELKELEDFLSRNRSVILLQSFDSPLKELTYEKNWKVIFKEFKTPILTEKTKGTDKSAFLIQEDMFREGIRPIAYLKYKEIVENYELFVVRAPFTVPRNLLKEPYISLSLSLFFLEKKEGNKLPVIYSLLAWLSWGSESFAYSYAKPKFLPLRLPKLKLHANGTLHTVPLGAALIELGYIASELHGKPINSVI